MLIVLGLAALLEFAQLSAVGVLTNQAATAAKSATLGHLGMRFVYRVFAGLFVVAHD